MTWDWRADPRHKIRWDTDTDYFTRTFLFHVYQRIPPFFGQCATLVERGLQMTPEFIEDHADRVPYLREEAYEWVLAQGYEMEMWGSIDGSEKYMAGGGELIGGSRKVNEDAPVPYPSKDHPIFGNPYFDESLSLD